MTGVVADPAFLRLLLVVGTVLVVATVVSRVLRARSGPASGTVVNLVQRVDAWWVMALVFGAAVALGAPGTIALFALLSFLAMREYTTLVGSSRADHRALLVAFFVALPAQYVLLAVRWYGLFAILIPVYAFLLIAAVLALVGETHDFLRRTATIQWGLATCVYALSYAPALLLLDVAGPRAAAVSGGLLLFFLVLVVQASDVLQYVAGTLLGRHPIAPRVSPHKTWEGFVGGVLGATAVGAALWWATPFSPWQAAAMSLLVAVVGFLGGLVMAAIKRDRGVKDYGELIRGHGGVLDRLDSLVFAAPVFFHVTRYFFA